jgi:fatty acid desaturase
MAVMVALHSSLQHEALHGHPTRHGWFNEALVFLPLGLFYPYRRFKTLHLRHHHDERLTDPYDDPESYYHARSDYMGYGQWFRAVLSANNTMLGRFLLGPGLMVYGFARSELALARAGDGKVVDAWVRHLAGLVAVFVLVQLLFGIPFWLYALTSAYFGLALITIRTFAEHRWQEAVDGRTIIVERSPLALLFLNNNLHYVHHKLPTLAWYRLPAAFRANRQHYVSANHGYVYPGYLALIRHFGLRQKEPVVHPALHGRVTAQTGFVPEQGGTAAFGGMAMPVPADMQKD